MHDIYADTEYHSDQSYSDIDAYERNEREGDEIIGQAGFKFRQVVAIFSGGFFLGIAVSGLVIRWLWRRLTLRRLNFEDVFPDTEKKQKRKKKKDKKPAEQIDEIPLNEPPLNEPGTSRMEQIMERPKTPKKSKKVLYKPKNLSLTKLAPRKSLRSVDPVDYTEHPDWTDDDASISGS